MSVWCISYGPPLMSVLWKKKYTLQLVCGSAPMLHTNTSAEREQMLFACSDFSYHELHTILLNLSIVLPTVQPIFYSLTECWRDHLLLCSQKNIFFSFYVPVFCLIMASEHKVKHKSIFCKSPELGFSFDQTQWANPNRWKQQHSCDFRFGCLIFWHVDCMRIIVSIVSSPHHRKV